MAKYGHLSAELGIVRLGNMHLDDDDTYVEKLFVADSPQRKTLQVCSRAQ